MTDMEDTYCVISIAICCRQNTEGDTKIIARALKESEKIG